MNTHAHRETNTDSDKCESPYLAPSIHDTVWHYFQELWPYSGCCSPGFKTLVVPGTRTLHTRRTLVQHSRNTYPQTHSVKMTTDRATETSTIIITEKGLAKDSGSSYSNGGLLHSGSVVSFPCHYRFEIARNSRETRPRDTYLNCQHTTVVSFALARDTVHAHPRPARADQ